MTSCRYELNRLRKDELRYELSARGFRTTDSQTVKDLRSLLKPLLKLEEAERSLEYPEMKLVLSEELVIIEDKLTELSTIAKQPNFSGVQIFSRLLHLTSRLDRLQPENDGDVAKVNLLREKVSSLLKYTEDKPSGEDLASLLAGDPDNEEPTDSSDEEVNAAANFPSLMRTSTRNVLELSQCRPDIRKWNIQFSGNLKEMSVHNFLERVEELRHARNTSGAHLFNSAIDLFTGKALQWFRSNRERFSDWTSLKDLLEKHYEPPDYRARLFKDILNRTQDPSESIVDYLTCMNSMFRRYGRVEEDIKLNIIVRNLAPFYSTQLPSVSSLQDLEDACLILERKKYRAESYVPPSRKKNGFVDPDFAFVSAPYGEGVSVVHPTASSSRSSDVVCWNCQKAGHVRNACPEPKKTVCYRCGKMNVTVRQCPNCSPGNGSRRN